MRKRNFKLQFRRFFFAPFRYISWQSQLSSVSYVNIISSRGENWFSAVDALWINAIISDGRKQTPEWNGRIDFDMHIEEGTLSIVTFCLERREKKWHMRGEGSQNHNGSSSSTPNWRNQSLKHFLCMSLYSQVNILKTTISGRKKVLITSFPMAVIDHVFRLLQHGK